jgi:hypothetical protein
LPLNQYYTGLGLLIHKICVEFTNRIFSLDDISELESNRLAELFDLNTYENMFMDKNRTFILEYTGPSYSKFKTLLQILTWSFSTIMDHFRMGALVEFDISELTHLIKALFSDSPLRVRNLKEISKGHQ